MFTVNVTGILYYVNNEDKREYASHSYESLIVSKNEHDSTTR